jgi:hypothetical protein
MIHLILGILLPWSTPPQDVAGKHQPPRELRRYFCFPGGTYLEKTETRTVMFSWDWDRVTLIANVRSEPGVPRRYMKRTEKVPVFLTAVAPRYYDSIYVVGVRDDGTTVIEQWTITVALDEDCDPDHLEVQKRPILESRELTYLRACAVEPGGRFLIAQHHETRELWRVSLPSGEYTTLLTPALCPSLNEYDVVQYERHVTGGSAYLIQGNGGHEFRHWVSSTLVLWDPDGNGLPDSMELLDAAEWRASGYATVEVWEPLNEFYPLFHPRRP